MSRQTRLVEQALRAHMRPHRSLFIAICSVAVRAGAWGLLIFGLAILVPMVLPALKGLQPKLALPQGPVMSLVDFVRTPEKSIPLALCLLVLIDLPIAYWTSGNLITRRWWSRLMLFIPLGIGLIAAAGFAWLYIQLLTSLVRDAGVGP